MYTRMLSSFLSLFLPSFLSHALFLAVPQSYFSHECTAWLMLLYQPDYLVLLGTLQMEHESKPNSKQTQHESKFPQCTPSLEMQLLKLKLQRLSSSRMTKKRGKLAFDIQKAREDNPHPTPSTTWSWRDRAVPANVFLCICSRANC